MTFYVLVYWEWRNCWRLDCHSTLNNGHLFQMWQASVLRCVLSLLCTLYCTVSCVRYVRQLYTRVGLSPEPIHINYFAPVREGEVLWWPCLSVSLSLCVCRVFVLEGVCNCTSDLHSSQKFLYMLPMAVARSSSASVAIRYAFPVLWMTSYLHIMGICTSEVPVRTAGQPDGTASLGQWPGRLCLRTAAESAVGP